MDMQNKKIPIPIQYKVRISSIEANLAFCEALIAFAGQIPDTVYRRAEIHVFRLLEKEFKKRLEMIKKEAYEEAQRLLN